MTEVEIFELLQRKQILLYSKDSLGVFSIFSKDEDDNVENIIEDSEKDIQDNYSMNKIKLL